MKKTIFLGVLLFLPAPLWAVDTVKSPLVKEGLLEFEHKGGYQHDSDPGADGEKTLDFAVGYGVTGHWKSQLESAFKQGSDGDFFTKAIKWKNTYNLNGKAVQDEIVWALYGEVEIAMDERAESSLEMGVLARRDFGKWILTGNVLLERGVGNESDQGVSFVYRGQTRYALEAAFQPAVEVLGDTQAKNAFRDQELMIGPVLVGDLDLFGLEGFSYELGYLFGVTPATHDGTLKWRIKYGITF